MDNTEITEEIETVSEKVKYVYVAETIDTYFGKDLSLNECNEIASTIPTLAMIKLEAKLMQTKWFDYRQMHPTHLGYLWAFYYRQAYKRFITTYRDSERGQYVNGIAGKDVFGLVGRGKQQKLCTSSRAVWKGRQTADKLGIPYDFYIRAIMNHAETTSWARPPRPNQLYSEDMIAVVVDAWNIKKGTQIVTAENNRFKADAYTGNCDQRDYQTYLVTSIQKRAHKEFGVHYCMVEKQQLLEPLARKAFGDAVVNKAKNLSLN